MQYTRLCVQTHRAVSYMWISIGCGSHINTSSGPSRHSDFDTRPAPPLGAQDSEAIGNLVPRLEPEAWITSFPHFSAEALGTGDVGSQIWIAGEQDHWHAVPCFYLCSSRQLCSMQSLGFPSLPSSPPRLLHLRELFLQACILSYHVLHQSNAIHQPTAPVLLAEQC